NQLDTRVKDRGDVKGLQIPFLGEIPQANLPTKWWQRLDKSIRYSSHNSQIVVKPGNRDMMNEAFRVMRTNLDLMTAGHPGCHRIMLTSFNPNAGKTYLIMNIAATMALKKSKVLLIDVDMRKGTLSNVLAPKKTGIASYLNGKTADVRESILPVTDNLWVLPVGNLPPNPAELLLGERFEQMLESLSKEYDYIFLDCPPIDMVADTGIIAKHADMTLFVMRAGLFDKRALPAAEELYESGKYNRMALVLNGVETAHSGYGHYGYGHYGYGHYGYGYGYGYGNSGDGDPEAAEDKKK
ncbi:MAG: CpsD/CapB family tyrosine-protein kinase, partial [Bacteroidales bacterium]|nr:CpsD/CapB family tyrosine-protein kinase [Bacteroidales bacterium]